MNRRLVISSMLLLALGACGFPEDEGLEYEEMMALERGLQFEAAARPMGVQRAEVSEAKVTEAEVEALRVFIERVRSRGGWEPEKSGREAGVAPSKAPDVKATGGAGPSNPGEERMSTPDPFPPREPREGISGRP